MSSEPGEGAQIATAKRRQGLGTALMAAIVLTALALATSILWELPTDAPRTTLQSSAGQRTP
jgi:hypothetical protein